MLPNELKCDKEGLLYIDCDNLTEQEHLYIDKRNDIDEYYQNAFCRIPSTNQYIIKYSCTCYTRLQIKRIKEMLRKLVDKQKNVHSVDFPIGYFVHMKKLSGLVIKYYQNSVSWDNVLKYQDKEYIGKFYYHDEDTIHNLFMLFNSLLDTIIELLDNNIIYTDLNPGNIVLFNNQVKLIDFDYRYIFFDQKKVKVYEALIENYLRFISVSLNELKLYSEDINYFSNLKEGKEYLKKLENNVHRSNVWKK